MGGIDEVIVYCVNDGAVMKAWGKENGIEGSMVSFVADPTAAMTKALDLTITDPKVISVLGNERTKRCAIYVEDNVVKATNISASDTDPTGDGDPSISLAEGMLDTLSKL